MSTDEKDARMKPARLCSDEHIVKAVQSLDHDGWVALKKAVDKWWQCEVCHGRGHRTESSWTKDGGGISWPTCTSCGGIGLRTREARLGDNGPPPGNTGEGASVSPSLPRRESASLGQVLTTPTSNCIHVSPYDVHERFRPGMRLVFASPGNVKPRAYRAGVAEVAGTGKTELAFMVPLNTLIPTIAVGDEIFEYEVPCTRCRCKSCEPVPSVSEGSK